MGTQPNFKVAKNLPYDNYHTIIIIIIIISFINKNHVKGLSHITVTLIFNTRYACFHHLKQHCLIKTHPEKKSKNEIKTSNKKYGMINNFVVSIYHVCI
jgi:hypothetical protein